MNYLQKWYIVIAILLGIGIPFLLIGLEMPSAIRSATLMESAEYVILDEEDADFWTAMPGRTGLEDIRQYYLYNCSNGEAVAARGEKPNMLEVGPFIYNYTHQFEDRVYHTHEKVEAARVEFLKRFKHEHIGKEAHPRDKEYRVLNIAGLKRWQNIKTRAKFQIALEGFYELFTFAKMNIIRDKANADVSFALRDRSVCIDIIKDIGLSRDQMSAMMDDRNLGLNYMPQNDYQWTFICDNQEPFVEEEIMNYFGLSFSQLETVKERFCILYNHYKELYTQELCEKVAVTHPHVNCTNYNITFYQWLHKAALKENSYADVTMKKIDGKFEFPLFYADFVNSLKPEYKDQLGNITFNDKDYDYLLDSRFEYPDYETNESSILQFSNMEKLFEAGYRTGSPFKMGNNDGDGKLQAKLDLNNFDRISKKILMTKEQAYVLYCYFDYFINNTILMVKYNGNIEKERIASFAALTHQEMASFGMDYIDTLIYSRALHKRDVYKTCRESIKFFFTTPETLDNDSIVAIAEAICSNTWFKSDVTHPSGWKYFIEALAHPYEYCYKTMMAYFKRTISNFSEKMLDSMLYWGSSNFTKAMDDIRSKVKSHYYSVTKGAVCEHTYSRFCSKKQFYFGQLVTSLVTLNPYPEADLPKSSYLADWWPFIKDYVEDYIIHRLAHQNTMNLRGQIYMVEVAIEVPVEFEFLRKYYKESPITKENFYNVSNFMGLYDTDILYYTFLKMDRPNEIPAYMRPFANMFFYNASKYVLRNVQFGPMFDGLYPEDIYFGYFNKFLWAEHEYLDYLEGDDCTVNPYIGYNLKNTSLIDHTFDQFRSTMTMATGVQKNSEIRQYKKLFNNESVYFKKFIFDNSGDRCYLEAVNPFNQKVESVESTDGLQFDQYAGKTPKGDNSPLIDHFTMRPITIVRPNDYNFEYDGVMVNSYQLKYDNTIRCPKGLTIKNSIDMTSFYQYYAFISAARLYNIKEIGMDIANITYTHPIEQEAAPMGFNRNESYYEIEPFTGLTVHYENKYMTNIVLEYDELYDKLTINNQGEIIPYYAVYESAKISNKFLKKMKDDITAAEGQRRAVMLTFSIIGLLLDLGGVAMIIISFTFGPPQLFDPNSPAEKEAEIISSGAASNEPLIISPVQAAVFPGKQVEKKEEEKKETLKINEEDESINLQEDKKKEEVKKLSEVIPVIVPVVVLPPPAKVEPSVVPPPPAINPLVGDNNKK